MSVPLLLDMYDKLPELRPGDDEDLWAAGAQNALTEFRSAVAERYTEGTLQRLLGAEDVRIRRAAILALGFIGSMDSNAAVASTLQDNDILVQRFAADALWELWFRGGPTELNSRLRQAAQEPDVMQAREELDNIIRAAPEFAEAYNQRAIWYFKRGEFARAAEDCTTVLRLNPYHFGAAAGLGQSYVKLNKPAAAIRAFRTALDINPGLEHLHETIRALSEARENGSRDD